MDSAKILVVEDTPLNMELVTDILEVNGYEVLQATEAQAGSTWPSGLIPI
jgi:CheY-like chemotaxis protein